MNSFNYFMLSFFSCYIFTLLIATRQQKRPQLSSRPTLVCLFFGVCFFFLIQLSVSDNTVISFHSKGRMGFFFSFILVCDV